MLKEMVDEAKSLIEEIEKEAKLQEDHIKTLQMARAFLEIEYAMGTVNEETYKRSIVALKNAQQKRLELLRTKEKINDLLEEKSEGGLEEKQEAKPQAVEEKSQEKEERKAIPVRITQE